MLKIIIPEGSGEAIRSFGEVLNEICIATWGYVPKFIREYYTPEKLAEEAKAAEETRKQMQPYLEQAGKDLARHKEKIVAEFLMNNCKMEEFNGISFDRDGPPLLRRDDATTGQSPREDS